MRGNFIITITKFSKKESLLKVKRRQSTIENRSCIYEFSCLDNYLEFTSFLKKHFNNLYLIFQKSSEFIYIHNKYILIVNGENFSAKATEIFNSYISEFANFKSNSDVLILKIEEFHQKNEQKKH